MLAFLIPIDADRLAGRVRPAPRARSSRTPTELAQKPHCVVFTKMDLLGDDEAPPIEAPDAFGMFAISAAARTGLDPLLAAWWSRLLDMKKVECPSRRFGLNSP